jgi:hypothetical protein
MLLQAENMMQKPNSVCLMQLSRSFSLSAPVWRCDIAMESQGRRKKWARALRDRFEIQRNQKGFAPRLQTLDLHNYPVGWREVDF